MKNSVSSKIKSLNIKLSICCIFIIALLFLVISKSYAIYKMQEEFDIIKSKIEGYTPGDVEVAVLVDGKESTTFPTYEDNYLVTEISCTNGATASWDAENWRIAIDDMSVTSTKCTVSFDSTRKNEIKPINLTKKELIALNEEITNISAKQLANYLYPVGSIFTSTELSSVEAVEEKFGGTWVRYAEGTMLLSADSSHGVNTSGGSSTVTLSSDNIPAHAHNVTPTGSVSSSFYGSRSITEATGSGYSIGYGSSTRTSGSANSMSYRVVYAAGTDYGGNHFAGWSGSNGYIANNDAEFPGAYHTHNYADYYATSISGVASHQHYFTSAGSVSSSFTGNTVTTTVTGSGNAFNVQNPYTAVYMYKRTA